MCIGVGFNTSDAARQAEGRLTTNTTLTGTALQDQLGDVYIYEDCLYPRLDNRPADYVQCSPVFLYITDDENYDTYNNINHAFTVSTKYNVQWESVNGRVSINNGFATLNSVGDDTLICRLGEFKKHIPITINSINNAVFGFCSGGPYTLTLKADPEDAAELTGEGKYYGGEWAIYTAIPNPCYTFLY